MLGMTLQRRPQPLRLARRLPLAQPRRRASARAAAIAVTEAKAGVGAMDVAAMARRAKLGVKATVKAAGIAVAVAAARVVEKRAAKGRISHEDIFELHRRLTADVMDQGEAGQYRSISVRVGRHMPPPPHEVSGLMSELIEWWNKREVGDHAWVVDAKAITANGFNLDIKNPSAQEDFEHLPPEVL